MQRARPHTPTDKPVVEATFSSINTLFCQHVAGYAGPNPTRRGADAAGVWTLPELQELLDEWLLAGWQPRPHEALRDALAPRRMLSPNEAYAAQVAAAGYLPLTLSGEDYLELLPVEWRQINASGGSAASTSRGRVACSASRGRPRCRARAGTACQPL